MFKKLVLLLVSSLLAVWVGFDLIANSSNDAWGACARILPVFMVACIGVVCAIVTIAHPKCRMVTFP